MATGQQIVSKLWFLRRRFCCGDVGPHGPNNKLILEEHLWHVASTTSTVASLRVARLGWRPSQANLPLHDGWRRTWQMCQWPWNVKSTIRSKASPTQTWIALGQPVATYNFAASPFLRCMISTWLAVPKLWFLSSLCCRDVGSNGPCSPSNRRSLEEHLWHVASTTSTVASLRVARQITLNRNLDHLEKTGRYLQLHSFTFFALHDGSCRTWQMCQWPWNVKSTISLSQIILNTNLVHLGKTGRCLQLHSFTFFALHDLYLV